ncbi:hypothetical protein J2S74_001909 [Evansella vedderi]|uniref:YviE n=1 Tax=Evansella vedderi TaxID=38282 RepID=A0ABT9ZWL3_9BACI|nr:DUF6470 family protein [Evansella vedderi]MDQ0254530.1 hypothetical protein [Evansella vedderi]
MAMSIPQINIHTERAEVGITQHRPEMQIRQQSADLHIQQELAGTLRISKTASKLFIDQSEAFADADLKGPLRRGKENAAAAMQNILQYIAKTAREGEQLKKIEHGGNQLAALAKQKGERAPIEIGQGTIPANAFRVQFNYVPSEIAVDVDWPEPQIQITKRDPEVHIPKWQTEVYLQQKQQIAFSVSGGQQGQIDRLL